MLHKIWKEKSPMKFPLTLCTLLIAASSVIAQIPSGPKQILHDFRSNSTTQPAKIPAATQKFVLSKVFRRYLSDSSKCNPNFNGNGANDYLKAARNAGQIAPSVIDSITGSFTAAGMTQTAYLISVSECGASHADNFGSDRVAIFAGQQLVADLDVDFKNTFLHKTDLNGDGIDEFLMSSGYMNQGELTESAALLSFQGGHLTVIQDLETVTQNSCGSGYPGSSAKAAVISIGTAMPGKMPRLQSDNYQSPCRTAKKWKFLSSGKMPG